VSGVGRAVAILIAVIAAAGESQERPSRLDPARVDFVIGNLQFSLLHELAHVAISDLDVPIVGPEEYAADYIATVSLLRPRQAPPQGSEQWLEFAMTTADAFVIVWQIAERSKAEMPYWDTHGLSIQRFYSIGCLIFGSDPERFATFPELVGLPEQRAQGCEAEYARALRSIDALLSYTTEQQQRTPGAAMTVRYEPARTRITEQLVAEIKSRGLIEYTVRRFEELVALDASAGVVLRNCGVPEAAWVADDRELIVCYELLDFYYALSADRQRQRIRSLLKP
jgi:hypothetical protein